MLTIAKKVSKKAKKPFIVIFIDMIYCGFKYQAGYYDYQEFEFYALNRKERKTYLTRGINNEIIKKYNDKNFFYKFDDKIIFNRLFTKYIKRDFISLKEVNKKEFKQFLKNKEIVIAKPIDGEGGHGIRKIVVSEHLNTNKLFDELVENSQFLVEDFVYQHQKMNKLYPKAVNTLRMFTFYHGGTSTFLHALLKIGNGGVVDNFSSGGMYTFLDENGKVLIPAIDQEDNIYFEHPLTKEKIVGFEVPFFEEAKQLVKDASKVVKEIGYVGWDVAITDEGPVLIEGNSFPGVFQMKASLNKTKTGVLPMYQKVMDIK